MSIIEDYEKNMNAFTFQEHQNFVTYYYTLEQKGLKVKDAIDYVKARSAVYAKSRSRQRPPVIGRCICGAAMLLLPVNTVPANMIGDGYKSVWICQNKNCMETLYNRYSINDMILKQKPKETDNGTTD